MTDPFYDCKCEAQTFYTQYREKLRKLFDIDEIQKTSSPISFGSNTEVDDSSESSDDEFLKVTPAILLHSIRKVERQCNPEVVTILPPISEKDYVDTSSSVSPYTKTSSFVQSDPTDDESSRSDEIVFEKKGVVPTMFINVDIPTKPKKSVKVSTSSTSNEIKKEVVQKRASKPQLEIPIEENIVQTIKDKKIMSAPPTMSSIITQAVGTSDLNTDDFLKDLEKDIIILDDKEAEAKYRRAVSTDDPLLTHKRFILRSSQDIPRDSIKTVETKLKRFIKTDSKENVVAKKKNYPRAIISKKTPDMDEILQQAEKEMKQIQDVSQVEGGVVDDEVVVVKKTAGLQSARPAKKKDSIPEVQEELKKKLPTIIIKEIKDEIIELKTVEKIQEVQEERVDLNEEYEEQDFYKAFENIFPDYYYSLKRSLQGEEESEYKYEMLEKIKEVDSNKIANEYLEKRKIHNFFRYLGAKLISDAPDNPIDYLINILNQCILYRNRRGPPPLLFQIKHVESLYDTFDPLGFGTVNMNQFYSALYTLGLTNYIKIPPVRENILITKEYFVTEIMKYSIEQLDEMIMVPSYYINSMFRSSFNRSG